MIRLVVAAFVASALIILQFALGYAKLGTPTKELADQVSVLWGVGSACLWGVSVIGNPLWSSFFNYFAAAFAALALGYNTAPHLFG